MSILSITTLQQPGATGAEATSLVTASKSLVATHNWSFLLAQSLMPAFNALLLGSVLYRSRLVPRILPVVGLIGAPLLLASTIATMFGFVEQYSAVTGIVTIPIFAWELGLGLWLTFKGFDRSAPIMVAAAADAADMGDASSTTMPPRRTIVTNPGPA